MAGNHSAMQPAPIISSADREQLADQGWLKVPQLIPPEPVREARESIYRKLSQAGLWVDGAWQDTGGDPNQDQARRLLKPLSGSRLLKPLLEPVLRVAEAICAQTLIPAKPYCQFLFTAPHSSVTGPNPVTRWTVPASVWHTDYPRDGDLSSYGVQIFTFIDDVPPGGGGTLVVAGSHRIRPGVVLGSKELKRSLRSEEFWRNLTDKQREDRSRMADFTGEVDGVALSLVELSGAPGDVYFTDLRLLHSLTPNTSPRPRLMMTQRLPTEGGAERIRRAAEARRRSA